MDNDRNRAGGGATHPAQASLYEPASGAGPEAETGTAVEAVAVPTQFAKDFDLVAKHYACPPDEVDDMKRVARADLDGAIASFGDMAARIRSGAL